MASPSMRSSPSFFVGSDPGKSSPPNRPYSCISAAGQNAEWRFFVGYFLVASVIVSLSMWGALYGSFPESFRYASFQVASILTTTGYASADFEQWSSLSHGLLLLSMLIGGSVGSTGGAVKCMRILVLLKHSYRELIHLIHPRAVTRVKLGRQAVSPEVLSGIWGFFILYVLLFAVSTLLVAATGVDLVTSFTSALACIGNVGPGLGNVGPMDNYADIPSLAKWVLSLDMLLGRLEIYTIIILLVPRFYRK